MGSLLKKVGDHCVTQYNTISIESFIWQPCLDVSHHVINVFSNLFSHRLL